MVRMARRSIRRIARSSIHHMARSSIRRMARSSIIQPHGTQLYNTPHGTQLYAPHGTQLYTPHGTQLYTPHGTPRTSSQQTQDAVAAAGVVYWGQYCSNTTGPTAPCMPSVPSAVEGCVVGGWRGLGVVEGVQCSGEGVVWWRKCCGRESGARKVDEGGGC